MFIETYYDERAPVPGSTSEPTVPYPELSGEELTVWRNYLPVRRQIRKLSSKFNGATIPDPVITEIERAKRAPGLFDRIEIWSRATDPMAVGVIGQEEPRYFSIARWGDAKLTLAQVKRRVWFEKFLIRLAATGGIMTVLVTMFAVVAFGLGFTFN
jgi:hypothetical protein